MSKLSAQYWEYRYQANQIGWDTGAPTTPFVEFAKTITNKAAKILIPGCGHAYEGEMLHKLGFTNVTLLDVSELARQNFLKRIPTFPPHHFIVGDFFEHDSTYDFILEQTFFCALEPQLRPNYAVKMETLLKPGGQLVGVLFKFPLTEQGPPFGGSKEEYVGHFKDLFKIKTLEDCQNSIKPRLGNELFIRLEKR